MRARWQCNYMTAATMEVWSWNYELPSRILTGHFDIRVANPIISKASMPLCGVTVASMSPELSHICLGQDHIFASHIYFGGHMDVNSSGSLHTLIVSNDL